MPFEIFKTFAKESETELLDVHQFNKYFSFQIERPLDSKDVVIQTRFTLNESAGDGFLFRLRAELSTAISDSVQQAMTVALYESESGSILVDATSQDDNEGSVKLEYLDLKPDIEYILKYEFFDKQLVDNWDLPENSISASYTSCRLPFITQELLLMDKTLVKNRIASHEATNQKDITKLKSVLDFSCDLNQLNNTENSDFGEDGVYCRTREFYYKANQNKMDLVKIYEQNFDVRGSNNEVITYWMDLALGYNFMVSPGVKVVISEQGYNFEGLEGPFSCLYDKSCIVSRISAKNEIKIEGIITAGKYKLTIFDSQLSDIRVYLNQNLKLENIPFTFSLNAYPVLQNEERSNCPYLFMSEDFVQNKFIDGMNGQRFSFSDKIIMNIFNQSQIINLKPESDSILKIRVKEAFGVNSKIKICLSRDCFQNSTYIGTTEILLVKVTNKKSYQVHIDYSNSIFETTNFFSCPHLNLEVSMIPEKEAKVLVDSYKCDKKEDFQSDNELNKIFNSLVDNDDTFEFQNQTMIFKSIIEERSDNNNYQVTSKNFRVPRKMQFFAEIFYEPYFYDMELFLVAQDSDLVRDHIFKGVPNVDWSLYKGSKSVFVELDPGRYEIKIIQKKTAIAQIQVQCAFYQLHVYYSNKIERQYLIPNSLNYYGLLGPNGTDFGQMVYHCQDCILENNRDAKIVFKVSSQADANFDAIIQSDYDAIGIKLAELSETQTMQVKGQKIRKISDQSAQEVISDQAIDADKYYQIVIKNKDKFKYEQIYFNVRIEITQKAYKPDMQKFYELLPKSMDEIMRFKMKTEGMKESEFIIGNKFMMKYMDTYALYPFVPLSNRVYQSKFKSPSSPTGVFQKILPFEVKEDSAVVFASIYDYTGVANLGLKIQKQFSGDGDGDEEFEVGSTPGKYHSFIPETSLEKGKYNFVIEPNTQFPMEDAFILKFGLDFVYAQENFTTREDEIQLSTMELCGLPSFPETLNSPQFIHPLSGDATAFVQDFSMRELLINQQFKFTLSQKSLVTFYIEVPKDLSVIVELQRVKGVHKLKASTNDLNKDNGNFLRQTDMSHENVIQIREYLDEGTYNVLMHAQEAAAEYVFGMPRCDAFTVSFTTSPIKNAQKTLDDDCYSTTSLPKTLEFDSLTYGTLVYSTSKNVFDTSYITTKEKGIGPFYFYFQLNYDIQAEGPIGLVLSKYDKEEVQFTEVQVYDISDQSSWVVDLIQEGTYVVSIQSMTSTPNKFNTKGISLGISGLDRKMVSNECSRMEYSYFVSSISDQDLGAPNIDIMDFIVAMFSGNIEDLGGSGNEEESFEHQVQKDVGRVADGLTCKFDQIPKAFPASDNGFDLTYTFSVSKKNFEIIDLMIMDQVSIIKIYIETPPGEFSQKNNVKAKIYTNSSMTELVAETQNVRNSHQLIGRLTPQRRPYKIKLISESMSNSGSTCPIYNFRISVKPLKNLVEQNLKCSKREMPPVSLKIDQDDYSRDGEYQVSSGFIDTFKSQFDITYDMRLNLGEDSAKKVMDFEIKYDFITSHIQLELFAIVKDSRNHEEQYFLSKSKWVNQYESQSESVVASDSYQSKDFISRLQYNGDIDDLGDGSTFSNEYILRLKMSKDMQKVQTYLRNEKLMSSSSSICFPFDLSIRISKSIADAEELEDQQIELMRVEFSSLMSEELFDSRQKLQVYLEFQEPITEFYKKFRYTNAISLHKENQQDAIKILPLSMRLSIVDKSMLILTFKHNDLEKGTCYRLGFEKDFNLVMNQEVLKNQTQICTSNCHCNVKGMKGCNEKLGQCQCMSPFTGEDCSKCIQGYVMNPKTEECEKTNKCKENGGTETCNGHGKCFEDQITGQSSCQCDLGFANDGFDLCAKCSDPMFTYPRCEVRNWILEETDTNCEDLVDRMPEFLYKSQETSDMEEIYENEEGQLNWHGKYKLLQNGQKLQQSSHKFQVLGKSVLRLLFDTQKSGVKAQYSILDDNQLQIFSSGPRPVNSDTALIVINEPQYNGASDNPYTLVITYDYKSSQSHNKCPFIELFLILQPYQKVQNYMKCTPDELDNSKQIKQFAWAFSDTSTTYEEKFTVNSDMRPSDKDGYLSDESDKFYFMKYAFKVADDNNALSFITSYNFASVILWMNLVDAKTKKVLAIEKTSMLEEIVDNKDVISLDNNVASYIEVPYVKKGDYELQILISKAQFLPSQGQTTCINFDLTLEYIVRTNSLSSGLSNDFEYQVISVHPNKINNLKKGEKWEIDVKYNKEINLDNLITNENDINFICKLQNLGDPTKFLRPDKVDVKKETLKLRFNFKKDDLGSSCYSLNCSTIETKLGKELIKPVEVQTKYCFEDSQSLFAVQCNPNALYKINKDQCICSFPYKGKTCEECERNYVSKQNKGHTVCALDQSKCSPDICNNHGQCLMPPKNANLKKDKICKCDLKYSGTFCERCSNSSLSYPDCSYMSSIENDGSGDRDYLERRKFGIEVNPLEKFKQDASEEQCLFTNYPKSFDAIEWKGVLGSFHIADYFTINHDQSNIIVFTPSKKGLLRFFLQQPEESEMILNQLSFDMEMVVYSKTRKQFLGESQMNQYLDLKGQDRKTEIINGKQEYLNANFEVLQENVGEKLLILFRVSNFSEVDESNKDCLTIYMEAEFNSQNRDCKYDQSLKLADNKTIYVTKDQPFKKVDSSQAYSIYGSHSQFFMYQDVYFLDEDGSSDFELTISIQQKFIETNQVDFVIEVLGDGVDQDEIQQFQKQSMYMLEKPSCDKLCLISGQKSYNEMHNYYEISPNSYMRLWFFQSKQDGSCSNFQVFLTANALSQNTGMDTLKGSLQCEELDLPYSLNQFRYLGVDPSNQQDFHYNERYRIDRLSNYTSHKMVFELHEPSLVRFAAPVHKHIEFDLELNEVQNGWKKVKKLVKSEAKDFEDTIFAQLDKGNYELKILFESSAFYMNQLCQSIQMEMAIKTVSSIKKTKPDTQNKQEKYETTQTITLQSILNSPDNALQIFKKDFIKVYQISSINQQFEPYETLYEDEFSLPFSGVYGMGILIKLESNFLLNDVNMALTHVQSGTIYHNLRNRENTNKILKKNLKPGDYELLVYTHNCLTNMNSQLSNIDLDFQIDLNFIHWSSKPGPQSKIALRENNQQFFALADSLHPNEFSCYQDSDLLPERLLPKGSEELDINGPFMIPEIGYYQHIMIYTPTNNQDLLKMSIERSNTKIKIQAKGSKTKGVQSHKINGGEVSVLTVQNLKAGTDYQITIEFGQVETITEMESEYCQHFIMNIKSVISKDTVCLSLPTETIGQNIVLTQTSKEIQLVFDLKSKSKFEQPLDISQEGLDVEVTLDFTSAFFLPFVQLYPNDNTQISKHTNTLENQLEDRNEIKPLEITNENKNLFKVKYGSVPQGAYMLVIYYYTKPKECSIKTSIIISAMLTAERIAQFESDYFGQLKTFQSTLDIEEANRYVDSLPLSLDTYKYLKDEEYILVSEYLQLNSNMENNKIDFTIDRDNTEFRIYIENDDILLNLREVKSDDFTYQQKPTQMTGNLQKGTYQITLDFFTDFAKQQILSLKNKVHITFMFTSPSYNQNYVGYQGKNLQNCQGNVNFPLALNRDTKSTQNDQDMIYSYPIIRLSPLTLMSKYVIDTYSFRLNETSRFYSTVGMHLIAHQLLLTLSDMKNFGEEFIGKQLGNLNIIDLTLPAGDYALSIEQAGVFERSDSSLCGLFSFFTRITPLKEMKGLDGGLSSEKQCKIKGTVPFKIYSSEEETKQGGEFFVNSDGQFFRIFDSIHYKKTPSSYFNPLYDKVQIDTREESELSLIMQFKSKGNTPIIKLRDQNAIGSEISPVFTNELEAANQVFEQSFTFKLSKGRSYTAYIYYGGEINVDKNGEVICEYYNLLIAVTQLSNLKDQYECLKGSDKKVKSITTDVPNIISDRDLDKNNEYRFSNFVEMSYKDFFSPSKPDFVMKKIQMQFSDEYDVDMSLKFDYPVSFFGMGLVTESLSEDNKMYYEDVDECLPLTSYKGDTFDSTLVRQIKAQNVDADEKTILAFGDEKTKKTISQFFNTGGQDGGEFCVYAIMDLKIKKKAVQKQILVPQIKSIYPQSEQGQVYELQQSTDKLNVAIEFTEEPYLQGSGSGSGNLQYLKINKYSIVDLVQLKFYNPVNQERLQQVKAVSVQKMNQGKYFSLIFDIRSLQTLKNNQVNLELSIDLDKFCDSKGTKFEMGEDVTVPKFAFAAQKRNQEIKKEQEKEQSEITTAKLQHRQRQNEITPDLQEVECLCVHGTCLKGSSSCNKCDNGWEGLLCDIRTQSLNVNQDPTNKRASRMKKMSDASDPTESLTQADIDEQRVRKSKIEEVQNTYYRPQSVENNYPPSNFGSKDSKKSPESYTSFLDYFYYLQDYISILNGIYRIIVLVVLVSGIFLCNTLVTYGHQLKNKMRSYTPISLTEYETEEESNKPVPFQYQFLNQLELKEFVPPRLQNQNKDSKMPTSNIGRDEIGGRRQDERLKLIDEDAEDEDTKKLSSEIMMFAGMSEQDQAQMMRQEKYDDEQPQHFNEADTANEIDNVLKEMNDDDEEDDETKGFF